MRDGSAPGWSPAGCPRLRRRRAFSSNCSRNSGLPRRVPRNCAAGFGDRGRTGRQAQASSCASGPRIDGGDRQAAGRAPVAHAGVGETGAQHQQQRQPLREGGQRRWTAARPHRPSAGPRSAASAPAPRPRPARSAADIRACPSVAGPDRWRQQGTHIRRRRHVQQLVQVAGQLGRLPAADPGWPGAAVGIGVGGQTQQAQGQAVRGGRPAGRAPKSSTAVWCTSTPRRAPHAGTSATSRDLPMPGSPPAPGSRGRAGGSAGPQGPELFRPRRRA